MSGEKKQQTVQDLLDVLPHLEATYRERVERVAVLKEQLSDLQMKVIKAHEQMSLALVELHNTKEKMYSTIINHKQQEKPVVKDEDEH